MVDFSVSLVKETDLERKPLKIGKLDLKLMVSETICGL